MIKNKNKNKNQKKNEMRKINKSKINEKNDK